MSQSTDPLPGPDGLPFVGSFLGFARDPVGFYDDLREYGDVVGYTMLGYDMCSVLDPDAIQSVLLEDADSYRKPAEMTESLDDLMGEGVLLTEGERWRDQRTLLQPMFYRERVETYGDRMSRLARDAAADWAGDTIDLTDACSDLTLRVICRTLLDVDVDAHEDVVRDAAQAIQEIGRAGSLDTRIPQWVPYPARSRRHDAVRAFGDAMMDVIDAKRDAGDLGDDMLSLLLDAEYPDGSAPTDTEIRDQLMTFLFAGHETTSLALTWAFTLLTGRPAVFDRLRAEVDDVVAGDRATVADLADLPFLDRVAKEVLRLRPPAAAVFREPRTDVELAGYRVPAGTMLVLPQFAVHTDPRYYDDPDTFRPDRWTDGFEDALPEYAYFPFGGGPRHCIGMRFANLELRLALATIVANVDVAVHDPAVDPEIGATLQPASPVTADVTPR